MTYETDYSVKSQQNPDDQIPASIAFIALAIAVGIVIALVSSIQQQRKPKTFREKLEFNLSKGGEVTAQTVKQLSKEINELRRIVEDRIENIR